MSRTIQKAIAIAVSSLAFFGIFASKATADIIQIPAIAFAQRAGSLDPGVANAGTLTTAEGKYYAAVPFPRHGERVCRFGLVHRDNDDSFEVIARLFKKRIIVGDSPFNAARNVQMAEARSGAGAFVTGVTVVNDTSISTDIITLNNAFYYVELEVTGNFVEVLGVQIEFKPAC
jgi:hypothetical protein